MDLMNPQNPEDPTLVRSSGNPSPTTPPSGWPWPVREPNSVNVPSRTPPIRDIDEGAFSDPSAFEQVAPAAPTQPIIPQSTPVSPPSNVPAPQPVAAAPQPPITPPPQAAQAILPPDNVPAVPAFSPQQSAPQQSPAPQPAPQPTVVTPVPQAPPVPATPQQLPPQPPPAVPTAIPAAQVQSTFTPPGATPTIKHLPPDLAAQLGETKNSSEINEMVEKDKRFGRVRGFLSFVAFVAGIFVAAVLINQFIFQSYYVEGTSMVPTLKNDDRLIIDKVERTLANAQGKKYLPERGQIVVLSSSIIGRNGQQEQLIKRVVGLPGDTIHIERGVVTIKNAENPDGFKVDESLGLTLAPTFTQEEIFETTVPEDQVFVMGDNRVENGSFDSRSFGAIPLENIEGRLWARLLPLDQAQIFD